MASRVDSERYMDAARRWFTKMGGKFPAGEDLFGETRRTNQVLVTRNAGCKSG